MTTLPMGEGWLIHASNKIYNNHDTNNDKDDNGVKFTEVVCFSREYFKCFEGTHLVPMVTI